MPVPQFVLDELASQCEGRSLDDLVFGDDGAYLPRPKSRGGWFPGAVKRAKVQKITPLICGIAARRSRSAPVSTCWRCLGCSDTPQRRSRSTPTRIFSTPTLNAVAEALDLKCAHSVPKRRPVGTVGA